MNSKEKHEINLTNGSFVICLIFIFFYGVVRLANIDYILDHEKLLFRIFFGGVIAIIGIPYIIKITVNTRSKQKENGTQKIRTAKSRINDFIAFIKEINGNNNVRVSGKMDGGKYETADLNDWIGKASLESIMSLYLFDKNMKIEWAEEFSYSYDDYYSKEFKYAFAEEFPKLSIKIGKKSLAGKAEEFARLYKKRFYNVVSEIIIDD